MSRCKVYWYGGARTVTDRMCAVAWYYNISPKADRGEIFIIHDQKLSYRRPLAGLPHCFYIMHIHFTSHFKCCCWLRSIFITTKYVYIYIYIFCLNSFFNYECSLPKCDVLCFHLFFFFFGAGLLMSFHGRNCPSIMIICVQPQTWGVCAGRW